MIYSSQTFTFSTEPWLVGFSIAVCALTFGLSYFAWLRSGYLKSVFWLELLNEPPTTVPS